MTKGNNPYQHLLKKLIINGETYEYFNLNDLNDPRYDRLPYSIRVLLESAIRNCDNFQVTTEDINKILSWEENQNDVSTVEVPFKPARVILQDFTGVPAVVDFAAMRDCIKELGGDPEKINPVCPADLVIDHSVQVDFSRTRLPELNEGAKIGEGDCTCRDSRGRTRFPHFNYHRPRSRHSSPHLVPISRPTSPLPGLPILIQSPYSVAFTPEDSVLPFVLPSPQSFIPIPMGSSYYTGSPYMMIPQPILGDSRPRWSRHRGFRRTSTDSVKVDDHIPSLRVPVSSLPSPQDASGIPIQDEICPFHQLTSTWSNALQKNEEVEFERNKERFTFLKWGSKALKNMLIVPPGSGIVHQVNLEYLARVVFDSEKLLYPDSLVGTDSHTTMINGLGVVGWGVGGIEAEAVMLGQAISMVLPKVVGYRIKGKLSPLATSTDVVLTITKHLRQIGVVGKFVEFFGEGVKQLSLADRATISNMCPEYGATIGYFPVDDTCLLYLRQSNRDAKRVKLIETYLRAVKMYRCYEESPQDPVYSEIVELDLSEVEPSVSGPKRPHDKVSVSAMKDDFKQCLINKPGFKGFGIPEESIDQKVSFVFEENEFSLHHGSVVIAAVTSCTNTSNPSVMLGAGLLAKKAVEAGLTVAPYIKTSLSPGSGVVTHYLQHSGVTPYLEKMGFDVVGYGCMTCIGNSGPLPESVTEAIAKENFVCCGVLSGNRNFEGRIHPNTRANYLASPLLVIAYAIAGTVDIDFELEPLGHSSEGKPIFLREIWPSRDEIQEVERNSVLPAMFEEVYKGITSGNEKWNALMAPSGTLYPWDSSSTYIKRPPFFEGMTKELPTFKKIENSFVLLHLGDSITTDHISPAGSIARNSAAARFLISHGLTPREFNSYGSRRGNDAVMTRGTFANIRLLNKLVGKPGPRTIHIPTGEDMDIFDAAMRYKSENHSVIVLAGKEYGSGSSRDWAAKGPFLLGIRAVIAESYERIHRSNLVGMGIIPLQFQEGHSSSSFTGKERFSIDLPQALVPGMLVTVNVNDGSSFEVILRFDTEVEMTYHRHGGILNYMIRKMLDE